ncbi:16646_t:CDS:2 [Dentiscutata erythropus]|uniref:16646_t:CDS:1 n=1 Tax=Dentiscutata erythropus TaxID=1348616 RepID=A0A9N9NU90_9GLOM|nr:16646_t:CDS:2 [Dentiscutata erythropus]
MDILVVDEPFIRGKSENDGSELHTLSFPDVSKSWNTIVIEPPMQAAAKAIGRKQLIKRTLLGLASVEQILEQGPELEHNQVIEYEENEQNFEHERNTETTQLIV